MRLALISLLMMPLVVGCGDSDEKPASDADTDADADADADAEADAEADADADETVKEPDKDVQVLTIENGNQTANQAEPGVVFFSLIGEYGEKE